MKLRKVRKDVVDMRSGRKKKILFTLFGTISVILMLFLTLQRGMIPVKATEEEIGRSSVDAYGGTFGEFVTMEMVAYDNNRDVGTYRFRYYVFHKGGSYTYQVAPVGLYLDDVHKATFDEKVGKDFSFRNDTRLFGTRDLEIPAGAIHRIKLRDLASGGMTAVTIDKDVYIPYPKYTVTYKNYDGTVLKSESVPKYSNATPPSNPSRNGYKFIGWNDTSKDVRSNKTIFTKWDAYPVIHTPEKIVIYDHQYTQKKWNKLKLKDISASDIEDGSLTNEITITKETVDINNAGNYSINYQVKDSVGSVVSKEIPVQVIFNDPPQISWKDYQWYEDEITKEKWEKDFLMKSVTGLDAEDGNITSNIKIVSDNVDPTCPGDYQVVYSVTDAFNKTTKVTAKIKIKYNFAPLINATNKRFIEGTYTNEEWTKKYVMEDIEAIDAEDGNISSKIKLLANDVDMKTPGFYHVTYQVTDAFGKKDERTIQVEIVYNQLPIIIADKKSFFEDELNEIDWRTEVLNNVSAYDAEDGDLTGEIEIKKDNVEVSKSGNYEVVYSVKDKEGKRTTKTIDVTIKPNLSPSLTICAENKRFVEGALTQSEWETYRMENVKANDYEENDITDNIEILKDTVKPNKAGTYEITYKVTDKYGKSAEKTIRVIVEENLVPVIHASEKWFTINDSIDDKALLKNVIAFDDLDGDISKRIQITNNTINASKEGDYAVTYTVTDSLGKTASIDIPIHITNHGNRPDLPPVEPPVKPSDDDAVVFANGKKVGKVQLSKLMEKSELINIPYDSVVFGVFVAEDIQGRNKIMLKKDDLIGLVNLNEEHEGFFEVYHAGNYYIKEVSVDNQYQLSNKKFYFKFEY